MNPLNTIKGTLIAGLAIAIVLTLIVTQHLGFNTLSLAPWVHIPAGFTLVGPLLHFHFLSVFPPSPGGARYKEGARDFSMAFAEAGGPNVHN